MFSLKKSASLTYIDLLGLRAFIISAKDEMKEVVCRLNFTDASSRRKQRFLLNVKNYITSSDIEYNFLLDVLSYWENRNVGLNQYHKDKKKRMRMWHRFSVLSVASGALDPDFKSAIRHIVLKCYDDTPPEEAISPMASIELAIYGYCQTHNFGLADALGLTLVNYAADTYDLIQQYKPVFKAVMRGN